MQTVHTKYKGPTDTKGSRIIAKTYKCRTVTAYDHELTPEENYERAAALHLLKAWPGVKANFVSGMLVDGSWAHIVTSYESIR